MGMKLAGKNFHGIFQNFLSPFSINFILNTIISGGMVISWSVAIKIISLVGTGFAVVYSSQSKL